MRAVSSRGRNSRLSFSILVWQLSLAFLCKTVGIRLSMCPGITLVHCDFLIQGGFPNYSRVTMAHRSNYAFLLVCICGRMSLGLVQWVHRTRPIPTWFLELTVNLVDFILSGYCNRAVHIGRACFISCFLFFATMTKLMNITTKFTVDLLFWSHDFKNSWVILESYFMGKVRFGTEGSYPNMSFSIFDFLKIFIIGACINSMHCTKIHESFSHSSIWNCCW